MKTSSSGDWLCDRLLCSFEKFKVALFMIVDNETFTEKDPFFPYKNVDT